MDGCPWDAIVMVDIAEVEKCHCLEQRKYKVIRARIPSVTRTQILVEAGSRNIDRFDGDIVHEWAAATDRPKGSQHSARPELLKKQSKQTKNCASIRAIEPEPRSDVRLIRCSWDKGDRTHNLESFKPATW